MFVKVLLLFLIAIISYALGSLNGAIIASKYIWKKDVRNYGSGNAGLTNFYRTFGIPGMVLVIIIDAVKCAIAVLLGGWLLGLVEYPTVGKLFAGFCVMMGHAFPALYQFKGGKGVLSAGVLVLMVDWRAGIICWLVFLACVIFTRYVSLGSVACALFFPLGLLIFGYTGIEILLGLFCALLLIFKHSANIGRLIAGKESRLELRRSGPTPKP